MIKKKLQWMLAAIFICGQSVFTSCANDDNPATSDGGKDVVTVKTAALYEQLGITDEINEFLADSKNYIYATVLLYDQQGCLKAKFTEQSHTLAPIYINVTDVADGTYTLMAIQTGVMGEPVWTLKNEENLAEVEMTIPNDALMPPYMSLGRATQTVTVKDGILQAEVSTEALGAIIESQVKGLTKEDNVNRVMLSNWIALNGIYLDPSRTGGNQLDVADYDGRRLNMLGDKEGAVIEGDVSWKSFSLYCVDKPVLLDIYRGKQGENEALMWQGGSTTLKPGGKYVVYLDNDPQQIKQLYCGTYQGLDAWLEKRAESPYAIYPYLKFGASIDEVRKHIAANNEYWISWYLDRPLPYLEDNHWWYDSFNAGPNMVFYYYETEDGKNLSLVQYVYLGGVLSHSVMRDELLKMGYTYKARLEYPWMPDDKCWMYQSEDGTVEAQINEQSDGTWYVSFLPYDPSDEDYIVD